MIVYGSITDTSIGQLFIAGFIPGLLLTGLFMGYILVVSLKEEGAAPREARVPLATRLRLLVDLVPPLVIFLVVMGSLYMGIATTTESAALGVTASLFFAWRNDKLRWSVMRICFRQTARTTGMILLIITAAFILNLAMSLTGVADSMTRWVASLGLSATQMLLILMLFYLLLGMFMDVMSMLVATVPITFPIVMALGVDPVWYGVFIVLMCELGMITPPVGMNLFVVHGIRKDHGSIRDAIRGGFPYAIIMLVFAILLIVLPEIVTWLPQQTRGF